MPEFRELLSKTYPELSAEVVDRVNSYRELVLEASKSQNLTRLTTPEDFLFGHVADVKALLDVIHLDYPAMDLGSGCGVPGLLAALMDNRPRAWILCESEKRKADFLESTVEALGVEGVQVYAGRAENYLVDHEVGTIVSRAVGKVEKLYGFLHRCSTWNKMVLFKGPGWEEEWQAFQQSKYRGALVNLGIHDYPVQERTRRLIELQRG